LESSLELEPNLGICDGCWKLDPALEMREGLEINFIVDCKLPGEISVLVFVAWNLLLFKGLALNSELIPELVAG